jgi:hypothetical protein
MCEVQYDDLVNKLEDLKSDLEERIAIQQAQEALNDMAEYRLAENLELFKTHFPRIYQHYVNYKPAGKYELVCNANGEPNLLIKESNSLFYGDSPFDDCRNLVDNFMSHQNLFMALKSFATEHDSIGQLHFLIKNALASEAKKICDEPGDMKSYESVPVMFMFGLGLGFQLGYLYERMTPLNLFIIEPDEEVFYYSLCVFDYTSLINYVNQEHLGLNLYLLSDPSQFVGEVNNYLLRHAGATLPELAMLVYKSSELNDILEQVKLGFSTLVHTSGFFDDLLFGLCHGITNISNGIPLLTNNPLPAYVKNKPVIVVGNGPSLDDDIDLLAKYQGKCIIMACGTAFSALCHHNIKADIYVAVERTLDVYESLLEITDHREFFMDTICMALDVVSPKVFNLFKHKIILTKIHELLPRWLLLKNKDVSKNIYLINRTNPLVSNFGVELASYLGFENIYLLGIDNGSLSDRNHSKFSMYFDENFELKEMYQGMKLDNYTDEAEGNFSPKVRTNFLFKFSARVMENTVESYSHRSKFYNCSNGMKIRGCIPMHFNEIDWNLCSIFDKEMFRTILLSLSTVKIDVVPNKTVPEEQKNTFNKMLDEILEDWEKKPKTRVEFVLREEYQSDYLLSQLNSGLLAAQAVHSSLASFFNYVNCILYHFQNEEKSIDLAYGVLRKYINGFFIGCKLIYEHSCEYEMGNHLKVFEYVSKVVNEQLNS